MTVGAVRLRPRGGTDPNEQLARSLAATEGIGPRTADVPGWLTERRHAGSARVRPIPFAELDGWSFDPHTGNLGHRSKRFFTIEGLDVQRPGRQWQQPIMVQPEIGILGIVAREFDGVLHLLMQAKMEPGNPNLVQLSPTVQATRSNYGRVHRGLPVRNLAYFTEPGRARVLADVLQSEHGGYFLHKRNRNMIVEVREPIPDHPDFCWLTLGQLAVLLRQDHVVHMDSRSVLACLPVAHDEPDALSPDAEVLAWFTGERARHEIRARRIPLIDVPGWRREADEVRPLDGRYFRVMAVAVDAAGREVPSWTQPLVEPIGRGLIAFALRRFGGVPHVLVRARVESGLLDVAELGPTVQAGHDQRPLFHDIFTDPPADRVRYAAELSEEGGRFSNAVSRYLVVETDEDSTPAAAPDGFRWVTPGQLTSLVAHSRYINVEARTLLAALQVGAVTP
ncbi:NDP-hexose 2,3-dehydratase family protein [Dactylosporangium sp. NPDC051485]|uniref:NDP-hexose 2,3-dehydratase family protein n=1 Tax=Dactylosporangium sp. NPDC051485 TaxID=3154846 RepID=UPI00343A23E2